MTKVQMLDALENAKQTHLAQMDKIKAVLSGKEIKNPTALDKIDCECGVWFYSHVEQIKYILGLQLFNRLDKSHENWHRDYISIYNIYFKKEKKGFFAKILGSDKIDDLQRDKAKLYFTELQKDTDDLLSIADAAIRRVTALNDSKFV